MPQERYDSSFEKVLSSPEMMEEMKKKIIKGNLTGAKDESKEGECEFAFMAQEAS